MPWRVMSRDVLSLLALVGDAGSAVSADRSGRKSTAASEMTIRATKAVPAGLDESAVATCTKGRHANSDRLFRR